MSDGRVLIEVELDTNRARNQYQNFGGEIAKDLGQIDQASKKASVSVTSIAKAIGLVKVAGAVFNTLKNSMDAAISRFDTFERFPKVMNAFGYSAEDSTRAVNSLSKGIDGLPTKLDDVVSTTQRLTAMTGNLKQSTQVTLALNNAFLASGSSASDASRGTEQYMQQLAKGEVDLQSWRTLQESMAVGLQRVAEQMGFTGEAATTDLYGALKSGEVTFREFQKNLVDLGTGTGELAQLAKTNSEGVATSFSNLHNAAAKGLANVIKALDELSIAITGKNIAQNIDNLKVIVNGAFDNVTAAIRKVEPVAKIAANAFKSIYNAVEPLIPTITAFVTTYAALSIIRTVNDYIQKSTVYYKAYCTVMTLVELATSSLARAELAASIASKTANIVTAAKIALLTTQNVIMGVLTGTTSLATAATMAFKVAMDLLLGPIKWVAVAISAVVAVGVGLYKLWNKETEAAKNLNAEQENLKASTDELASSIDNNIATRKDDLRYAESTKKAYQTLAQETEALATKQNRSAGETKTLKDNIEQLNKNVDGLNLAYDEENKRLSMNTEEINKRIEAYSQQEKANQAQEQLVEILKEQNEIEMKLKDVNELREEWAIRLENGEVKAREAKAATEELDAQEQALKETQGELQVAYTETKNVQAEAAQAAAQAVADGANQQIVTYATLSEAQQSTVDKMRETYQTLADSATNAFEKIETQSDISLGSMLETMQHNQQAVAEWGENQANLLKWAGENGYNNFIPFIENIGVDQAGVLANMALGLDANNVEQAALLSQLAETYGEGFGTAAKAGEDALSLGLENIPEVVRNMMITPVQGLNEEVKTAFTGVGEQATAGVTESLEVGKEEIKAKTDEVVEAMKPTDKAEELKQSYNQLGQAAPDGMKEGIDANAQNAVSASEKMAGDTLTAAKAILDSHSPSKKFMQLGADIIDGLVIGIGQGSAKITAALNVIETAINSTFNQVNTSTAGTFDQMGAQVSSGMTRVTSTVATSTNVIQATFSAFNNTLNASSVTAMNAYVTNTISGMTRATQATTSGVNNIKSQHERMRTDIISVSASAMNSFVSGTTNGMSRAVSATNAGKNNMIGAVSGLSSAFYNAGVNASNGLASGIRAGAGSAIAAANSLASQVANTMKAALQIHSPSRLIRDEVGRFIPQGLAEGIKRDAHYVDDELNKLIKLPKITAESAIGLNTGGFGRSISNITNNSTRTINNQPQVTMHVVWKGEEDIHRTMDQMGWIMNIEEKGGLA